MEKISFNEKDFRSIITQYNKSSGYENKIITDKTKPIHFIIASAGGMIKNNDENEIFFQLNYRTYFPSVSRSTSLNIGLNYFIYKYAETGNSLNRNKIFYTSTLISLPLQIQKNILNKNIRPYAFAGLSVNYSKVTDDKNNAQIQSGFQKNFGIGLLYGAGIEVDIYKGLMLKSEYRYEIFSHLILFGIGYHFSKH